MKELCTKAKIDNIDEVYGFLDGKLAEDVPDISRRDALKLHMVIDEIFNNIVSYAYDDEDGNVWFGFSYIPDAKQIILQFQDGGMPYDPTKQASPDITLPTKERKPGGLGLVMVRKVMDTVSYEYCDGKNVLTMSKNLDV